jgi:cysteinyl-tRNA synthetase
MDLSWQSINAAFIALQRWREKYQLWLNDGALQSDRTQELISSIYQAFCDDLDTPRAMITLRGIEKDDSLSDGEKAGIFQSIDALFGLDLTSLRVEKEISEHAASLLSQREHARSQRDFATSDALRDQLLELGIEVRDSAEGQSWSWRAKIE